MSIFFFLSSYLITELLQKEMVRTGAVHLGSFYVRRILRIWPLYFAFIGCCYLVGRLIPVYHIGSGIILAYILLAGNWYVSSHGFPISPINPLWSISLEEQFYLFWPSIGKFAGRSGLWAASMVLIPISFVVQYYCVAHGVNPWFNTFVEFLFFSLGAMTALVLNGRTLQISLPPRIYMLLAGAALLLIAETSAPANNFVVPPVPHHDSAAAICATYALAALSTLLIFCGLLGMPARLLPSWLTYLGRISYGLYVFHGACLFISWRTPMPDYYAYLGHPIIAMALTLVLAVLSYEYFEKPFLTMKERFTFIPSRAA